MFWKKVVVCLTIISSILSLEDSQLKDLESLDSAVEVNTEDIPEIKDLVFDSNFTSHSPSEANFFDYLTTVADYNAKLQENVTPLKKKCEKRWIRKEFRDLTKEEQGRYIGAINKLYNTPSKRRPGYTLYEEFAMIHVENADQAHSSAQFLPWHRAFIYEFEQVLMGLDPRLTLPYWDWTVDAYFPERSEVLKTFGSSRVNGDRSAACITEGNFKTYNLSYPYPHCISRGADLTKANPSRWMNGKELSLMVATTTSYPRFAFQFEVDSHSLVHFYLAGSDDDDQFNIGDMYYMHSPNDPLFFLHHGFVDKTFHEWQSTFDSNRTKYGGRSRTGTKVFGSDIMIPWDYDVATVLDIDNLCYSYQPPINVRKPEFLQPELKLNGNSKPRPPTTSASSESEPNQRHIDLIKQRLKYGLATGSRILNLKDFLDLLEEDSKEQEDGVDSTQLQFNCEYFKVKSQKKTNSTVTVVGTDPLPKNLTSSQIFTKPINPQSKLSTTSPLPEEVTIPYITPSDKYLKRMGIDKQKFLQARRLTESIGKAVKEFELQGVDIPNIEEVCK